MLDFSLKPTIEGATHWSEEINQLYHPTAIFEQDSQDLVYAADNINITKFAPILLKEWFCLVELNGYLVVDYCPNEILDWQKLSDYMWWLWQQDYEVVFHGAISNDETEDLDQKKLDKFIKYYEEYYKNNLDLETLLPKPLLTEMEPKTVGGYIRFVCKKICSTKITGDSIDKWSFGIVTNGKRKDWVEKIIQSIRKQNIPNYEILICGTYFDRKEADVKYIPFNKYDDKGWIAKKKNLIVGSAKYENLCIIHDRLFLDDNWYSGIKKWGNCFDHLSCRQIYNNQRINDWELNELLPGAEFSFVSLMDYKDWDFNICQAGQLHIAKKKYFQQSHWNEAYLWGRPEDLEISNQLRSAGHILRINIFSEFQVLSYKFGELPEVVFDKLKLSKKRTGPFFRIWGRKIYGFIYKNNVLKRMSLSLFKRFYS